MAGRLRSANMVAVCSELVNVQLSCLLKCTFKSFILLWECLGVRMAYVRW
jgi:hypothetical protein